MKISKTLVNTFKCGVFLLGIHVVCVVIIYFVSIFEGTQQYFWEFIWEKYIKEVLSMDFLILCSFFLGHLIADNGRNKQDREK